MKYLQDIFSNILPTWSASVCHGLHISPKFDVEPLFQPMAPHAHEQIVQAKLKSQRSKWIKSIPGKMKMSTTMALQIVEMMVRVAFISRTFIGPLWFAKANHAPRTPLILHFEYSNQRLLISAKSENLDAKMKPETLAMKMLPVAGVKLVESCN